MISYLSYLSHHCSTCGDQVDEYCSDHPAATIESIYDVDSLLAARYAREGLDAAVDAAVDVNQDWVGEATWCLFSDGSALRFCGADVTITTAEQYRARGRE